MKNPIDALPPDKRPLRVLLLVASLYLFVAIADGVLADLRGKDASLPRPGVIVMILLAVYAPLLFRKRR